MPRKTRNTSLLPSPGPYRLAESRGGSHFIYAAGETEPLRPTVKLSRRHTKQQLANAQLLAAAWDLREACAQISREAATGKLSVDALIRVEDAIAKAEGKL